MRGSFFLCGGIFIPPGGILDPSSRPPAPHKAARAWAPAPRRGRGWPRNARKRPVRAREGPGGCDYGGGTAAGLRGAFKRFSRRGAVLDEDLGGAPGHDLGGVRSELGPPAPIAQEGGISVGRGDQTSRPNRPSPHCTGPPGLFEHEWGRGSWRKEKIRVERDLCGKAPESLLRRGGGSPLFRRGSVGPPRPPWWGVGS